MTRHHHHTYLPRASRGAEPLSEEQIATANRYWQRQEAPCGHILAPPPSFEPGQSQNQRILDWHDHLRQQITPVAPAP
jgi:hypothetical protein